MMNPRITTLAQIETAIRVLAELQHIEEAMSAAAFVNPASKRVEDDDEEDLQHIASR
jgi:hypothetical protein